MKKDTAIWVVILILVGVAGLSAQPWVTAASNAQISVQTIVRYLAYIAIVFAGITYMLSPAGSHRVLAGIFIGGVVALGANSIVAWFPN